MTDTVLQAFLEKVEAYLVASGTSATALGQRSVNDSHAVHNLRKGVPISSIKMSKINRFMEENPPQPTATNENEAA